jgi:hypothetical protein
MIDLLHKRCDFRKRKEKKFIEIEEEISRDYLRFPGATAVYT